MKRRASMLIGVAISWDIDVIKKETENILEYEKLTTEIQGMYKGKNQSHRTNKTTRTIPK